MEIALSTIITMFIIMLGPVKLILPFAHATANADGALKREIALRAALWASGVALICLLAGGLRGGEIPPFAGDADDRDLALSHDICLQPRPRG